MVTAKVLRVTATGTVRTNQLIIVSAVQVLGGSAADGAVLYDNTSAVAADKKLQVKGGSGNPGNPVVLNFPIRFENLHVTFGIGTTEVLIHYV